MVYHLLISIKDGKKEREKDIYLSAASKNELYRRLQSQYGTSKDNVKIIEEIKDEDIKI